MEFNSYSRIYRYHISSMMDLYILLMEFVVQWWFCDFFKWDTGIPLEWMKSPYSFLGKKKHGDKSKLGI